MPSITKEKKTELVQTYGKNPTDTGNSRVQISILTERIVNLTAHIKLNRKDVHTTRGLSNLVAQRRKLLDYYAKQELNGYRELIKTLGLRR